MHIQASVREKTSTKMFPVYRVGEKMDAHNHQELSLQSLFFYGGGKCLERGLKKWDTHKGDLPRAPGAHRPDRWAARWCSRNNFIPAIGSGEEPRCSSRSERPNETHSSLSAGARGTNNSGSNVFWGVAVIWKVNGRSDRRLWNSICAGALAREWGKKQKGWRVMFIQEREKKSKRRHLLW